MGRSNAGCTAGFTPLDHGIDLARAHCVDALVVGRPARRIVANVGGVGREAADVLASLVHARAAARIELILAPVAIRVLGEVRCEIGYEIAVARVAAASTSPGRGARHRVGRHHRVSARGEVQHVPQVVASVATGASGEDGRTAAALVERERLWRLIEAANPEITLRAWTIVCIRCQSDRAHAARREREDGLGQRKGVLGCA